MGIDAQCCTIKKQFVSGVGWRWVRLFYASCNNEVCKSRNGAALFPKSLRSSNEKQDDKMGTFDRWYNLKCHPVP